ncbi:hypothetical protein BN13_800017 [Nostocoides jenkinsii Ben 74]|uniref:Uncharacterized protein n=1 Tax=Nostocoides jenkinsii Ben 74 TaxID=1193518 RepID=A0A077MBI2_9MICO|nr:hypothetical protein BN13_800017 [Tetrasphaera jenkinsii Ben 74]
MDRVQAIVAEAGDGELVGAHEVVLPESVLDGDSVPAQLHHDRRAVTHQNSGPDVELDRLAHAETASGWCTTMRVACVIGASRSQSICPLQMPCHIADRTCPPPASSSRTSATVPSPSRYSWSRHSEPAYHGIGRRKPWIHIRFTRRTLDQPEKTSCLQPTSAHASAVSRTFSRKSSSCRLAGRASQSRMVPSSCWVSRSGVCSMRRPRRLAGSRSLQGCATSHVTSARRSSSRTRSCSSPDSKCRWVPVVTEYAYTGTCPDFAFTFGVRVRCRRVTAGRSSHGHTARSAPTSNNHSVSSSGHSTTGAGRFRACEIDSSTRRHLRFCPRFIGTVAEGVPAANWRALTRVRTLPSIYGSAPNLLATPS